MPLYRITGQTLERVAETTFAAESIRERGDIQRLLRADITVLSPDLMVVAEEFGDWADSQRRIDLLCVDKDANLVVVELKRTEDGGHMELQAIRYAAMVSSMTFERLVAAHARYIGGIEAVPRAEAALLDFLDWETPSDGALSDTVRIVLLSADFSTELTTAVMWLNKRGLDVSCFRLKPHRLGADVLIDIQQIIPLPEAAEYEVKVRAQRQEAERAVSARGAIFERFWSQLIDRSRSRTGVVANRSTSRDHWLTGSIGKAGFQPTFTMKQHDSRVEMYIDLGKGGEQRTKASFQALYDQKEAIEREYGAKLEWQPLPEKRGCRIYGFVDGGWKTPEDEWPDLQSRLIDAMVQLERAFRTPVGLLTV
ncbi:DUF4268 domain-containing protein [Sphingomonas yantingensis]|uniref:DUF4268 domain-containing protein n=1 Tax=Sphingomonas yantingensis TaxID=1241761 RepID=A0A7W9EHV3_9SPHN|nr:DUF4268 domain-containing protein [Sphingomonas yantingensis]MBB5698517.1 hypothetical protein [Sphingomonas yantingensis]